MKRGPRPSPHARHIARRPQSAGLSRTRVDVALHLLGSEGTGGEALLAAGELALAHGLHARPAGRELLGDVLLADALGLLVVDGLDEHTLVLVHVTLALKVELVVEVAVNLLGVTVLGEQATEDAHPADPKDLRREVEE